MIRIETPRGLADTLRTLRHEAGLKQADVAAAAGCHPARISHAERYHRGIGFPVAIRHLAALGYGLAIVPLDGKGPETALSATEAAQRPSAGIPGGVGGAEAISGASEAVALCGCPVRNTWARIVSHSRECCDRATVERLARHLDGEA